MNSADVQAAILIANMAMDLAIKGYAIAKDSASSDDVAAMDKAFADLAAKAAQVQAYEPLPKPE